MTYPARFILIAAVALAAEGAAGGAVAAPLGWPLGAATLNAIAAARPAATVVADRRRPQAPAGRATGGQNFNTNNFRRDVSSNRVNSSRRNSVVATKRTNNVAVNNSRNVVVTGNGGCCNSYNSGPGWGGVAAGVVAGAAVGAIVTSAATTPYTPPPPYVPPGYVVVPAY